MLALPLFLILTCATRAPHAHAHVPVHTHTTAAPRFFTYTHCNARRLEELFAEIDINGDREMSWEEFTAYIIKNGALPTDAIKNSMKRVSKGMKCEKEQRGKRG